MKTPKHTKGPWKVRLGLYDVTNDSNFLVACDSPFLPDEECKANAHLIAAAPEMLELIEAIHFEMTRENGHMYLPSELLRVIKKARGDS